MLDSPTWALRRIPALALAALVALASLAAAEGADAKKKRKAKSAAGLYSGTFIGLPPRPTPRVTFRLNPDGSVVNFTLTNLPLSCFTLYYGPPDEPGEDPAYRTQLETLAAPPMSVGARLPRRGLPAGLRFRYEDPLPPEPEIPPLPAPGSPPFRGIYVDAKSTEYNRFIGRANIAIFEDTRGAEGFEQCSYHDIEGNSYVAGRGGEFDWFAVKKVKRKKKK